MKLRRPPTTCHSACRSALMFMISQARSQWLLLTVTPIPLLVWTAMGYRPLTRTRAQTWHLALWRSRNGLRWIL